MSIKAAKTQKLNTMNLSIYNINDLAVPNVGREVLDHLKKQIVSVLKNLKKAACIACLAVFQRGSRKHPFEALRPKGSIACC